MATSAEGNLKRSSAQPVTPGRCGFSKHPPTSRLRRQLAACWSLVLATVATGGYHAKLATAASPGLWELVSLKRVLAGSSPGALAAYSDSGDPCRGGWGDRVACNEQDHIIALNFTGEGLKGTLPGKELSTFRTLVSLDFGQNSFTGHIPPELASLTSLTYLSLASNNLTGAVPSWLGLSFLNLVELHLSNNHLERALPESIGGLQVLQTMDLSGNRLTGSIPQSIHGCNAAMRLNVSFNSLTGSLPASIGSMRTLQALDLQSNHLSGSIPEAIGHATTLTLLSLDGNLLSGPITSSLGKLPLLHSLGLSNNKLEGPIPESFRQLPSIAFFDASHNTGMNGPLPDFLGDITTLQSLSLQNCSVSGPLPPSLTILPLLSSLLLSHNALSGALPPLLSALSSLSTLHLSNNLLSGNIPESICNTRVLADLDLSANHLQGRIPPCLVEMPTLQFLSLAFNNLSGPLPQLPAGSELQFIYNHNCLDNAPQQACALHPPGSISPAPVPTPSSSSSSNSSSGSSYTSSLSPLTYTLVALLILTVASIVLFSLFGTVHHITVKASKKKQMTHLPEFTVSRLRASTRGFSTEHGRGSFGTAYIAYDLFPEGSGGAEGSPGAAPNKHGHGHGHGYMQANTHVMLPSIPHPERHGLVKRARDPDSFPEAAFCQKIALLAAASNRHPCMVHVKGFCANGGERMVVLELVTGGTLHQRMLRGDLDALTWEERVRVAVDVASALYHLHFNHNPPFVHRAVTSFNVLLTEDMTAKLSDLGLARGSSDASGFRPLQSSLGVATTADVLAYGVLLLELITGQTADGTTQIVATAAPFLDDPQMMPLMADAQLGGHFDRLQLEVLASLARACIQDDAAARPTMPEIRQALEQHLQVDPQVFEPLDVEVGGVTLGVSDYMEGGADAAAADGGNAADGGGGAAAAGDGGYGASDNEFASAPLATPLAAAALGTPRNTASDWAAKIVATFGATAAAPDAGSYSEGQAGQGEADSSVLLESGFSAPVPKGSKAKTRPRQGARGRGGRGRGVGVGGVGGGAGGGAGSSVSGAAARGGGGGGVGGAAAGAWAAVGGVVESVKGSVSRGVCVGVPGSVSEVRDVEAASLLISRPRMENGDGY
ncbi:hypothetical protein CLOP_g14218 [Closterium sp. NIES-67]|nr:hypothetical protein CLOP_g14218 [Closterium sp. NIES-67]